jgi:hypothetical protein
MGFVACSVFNSYFSGVKLVAVSTGTPAQAKAFKEEFKFGTSVSRIHKPEIAY